MHARHITLSSAAPYLLSPISELRAKCGNEKPSSFLRGAVGPPGGYASREEGVNNVGINKYSEGDRGRVTAKKGKSGMREVLPINQPAQHYYWLPESLSIQDKGISESAPSDRWTRADHASVWVCVCLHTSDFKKEKTILQIPPVGNHSYRYLFSTFSTLLRSLFFACITRWQPDYKWVRLINNVFTKSGLFVYSFVCILRVLLMESLPRDLSRWNVGWWWDESICRTHPCMCMCVVLFLFFPCPRSLGVAAQIVISRPCAI